MEAPMNMNVSLTDELANFVEAKVAAGRYTSSSEVVREALRLMEKVERQEAEKLGLLRQA
jgi:antitoxin ParD1/3/4